MSKNSEMIEAKIVKKHQQLFENLQLVRKLVTIDEICELLDISAKTWYNRLSEPWKRFSIDDLRLIADYCDIDFIQLVDGKLKIGGYSNG